MAFSPPYLRYRRKRSCQVLEGLQMPVEAIFDEQANVEALKKCYKDLTRDFFDILLPALLCIRLRKITIFTLKQPKQCTVLSLDDNHLPSTPLNQLHANEQTLLPSLLFSLCFPAPCSLNPPMNSRLARCSGRQKNFQGRKYEAQPKIRTSGSLFRAGLGKIPPQYFPGEMGLARNCRQVLNYDDSLGVVSVHPALIAFAPSKQQHLECEIGIGVCYYKLNQ